MTSAYSTDCDSYLQPLRPLEGACIPTEADLFGPASTVAALPAGGIEARIAVPETPGQSYAYEAVVLGVFAMFCYLLHSYRTSLAEAFKIVTMQLSSEKAFQEQTLFFKQFLSLTTPWGLLLIGGLIVRYGDLYGLYALLPGDSAVVTNGAVAGILAAAGIVAAYRYLMVRAIGTVTLNGTFFSEYRFMSQVFSAFAYTLLTPLFLTVALTSGNGSHAPLAIVAIASILLYTTYLTKSYRFFVRRNVSIMQWILYLCTVEFFPVSFFVLAVMRNR